MVSLLHDSTEVLIKAEEVSRVVLAFAARPVAPIQGGSDRYQFQFMVMTHLVRVGIEMFDRTSSRARDLAGHIQVPIVFEFANG